MSNALMIPYSDLEKMAVAIGKGKLFGKSPDELLPLMLIAQAEGKHPAIVAQEYDIIQGKPALNARSAQARFQDAGGTIAWIKRTDQEASAEFFHPKGGKLVVTWTMDRANKAGLTGKDNWKKYPAQMLSSRVISEGVRAVLPGCMSGFYTSDEVADFAPATTVQQRETVIATGSHITLVEDEPVQQVQPQEEVESTKPDERLTWPAGKLMKMFAEFARPIDEKGEPVKDWFFTDEEFADLRNRMKSSRTPQELVKLYDLTKAEFIERKKAFFNEPKQQEISK